MSRSRNIKPSFFQNEHLAETSPHARLLFIGLWCIADREGRLEDRPKRIKVTIFPYEDVDVDSLLNELVTSKGQFILRYKTADDCYIQILNFVKHQHPHIKECASIIQAPDKTDTSTIQTPDKEKIPYVKKPPTNKSNRSTKQAPDKTDTSTIQERPYTPYPIPHTDSLKPENDAEVSEIFTILEQDFRMLKTDFNVSQVNDFINTYGTTLVLDAFQKAVKQNARKLTYVEAILKDKGNGNKPKTQPHQGTPYEDINKVLDEKGW
jgi:DnaD/phage-associated family protein